MRPVIILYDDWCPDCTRFSIFIKKIDWLRVIDFQKLRDSSVEKYTGLNLKSAEKEMATYVNTWKYGFSSLFRIALRIPLLWSLLPLMYVLNVSRLGQRTYRYIAEKRRIIPTNCTEKSCFTSN